MPQKSPEKSHLQKYLDFENFLRLLLTRTASFRQFRADHQTDIERLAERPLDPDRQGDRTWAALTLFLATEAGKRVEAQLRRRLGQKGTSVQVIPCKPEIQGLGLLNLDFSPNLWRGHYLILEIDLEQPLGPILKAVEDRYHLYSLYLPPRATPTRGLTIPEPDEAQRVCRAYDLIELEGLSTLEATRHLFPETQGKHPSYDFVAGACLKKIIRWHSKVKSLIRHL